jgi:hypothetical protein
LSKSAQGINTTSNSANPNLPSVNMGANVRTPGDNQYRPKQPVYRQRVYQSRQQRPAQYYYEPGQNNQSHSYRPNQYSKVRGTATYAEQGYGEQTSGARRF